MTPRPIVPQLVALFLLPVVAGVWIPPLAPVGLILNLILAAVVIADAVLTPSPRSISVSREVPDVLSVGARNPVTLNATNRSRYRLELELHDETPQPAGVSELPARLDLEPWRERTATYHVEPRRRGRSRFEAVHLRYTSLLGFWSFLERRPLESAVRIYPDIRAVRRFDLLARRNRLSEIGLKVWRLRGQGGDFERLREYRREDELRHIDWKATAKHQRLISREYTVDRNQNILLLLDCGRSMCNETDGISHLDRGLNAAIILSYIALGQDDNVGIMAFSNRIERAVGPVRGKPAIQTVIRETFDLEPRWEASDYGMVCEELVRRQRKRALVVLITHALDEQHLLTIGTYARTLTSNHLLLCVFLRDVALVELSRRVPGDDVEAFRVAAAAELLATQARKIEELRDSGVLVLETLPTELSSAVINQYLDLKARHLL